MADFTVVGGHFSVRVNDGHFEETYEIDAASPEAAKLVAADRWRHRNDKALVAKTAAEQAAVDQQRAAEIERYKREGSPLHAGVATIDMAARRKTLEDMPHRMPEQEDELRELRMTEAHASLMTEAHAPMKSDTDRNPAQVPAATAVMPEPPAMPAKPPGASVG